MKEQRRFTTGTSETLATVLVCDCGCREVIDYEKEPVVVEQTSIALQHPDGFDEYVHESNEQRGRVRYFRLACYQKGGCGAGTVDERARCEQRAKAHAALAKAAKPASS